MPRSAAHGSGSASMHTREHRAYLPTPYLAAHTSGPTIVSGANTVKQGTRNPATSATLSTSARPLRAAALSTMAPPGRPPGEEPEAPAPGDPQRAEPAPSSSPDDAELSPSSDGVDARSLPAGPRD